MLFKWGRVISKTAVNGVGRHGCARKFSGRTYGDAVTALNTLQSNFSVVDAIRKSGRGMNKLAIPEMVEWLRRIGYDPSDFDPLNAIHIAGTKGKGSTAAFVSSILAQYISPTNTSSHPRKIGLYTSPHLRFVRERIQIDNVPVSEEAFAESFFELWDRLETAQNVYPLPLDRPSKPVYFRYLTLMALHTYLKEKVDPAVIECGIGGEYDSTNILEAPFVTGITSLGIDHTAMLGSTIGEIAWHKAGIMKTGAPAFTSPQPPQAMKVLRERAMAKEVHLKVVDVHPEIASGRASLGLEAAFQKINASLAVELAATYLRKVGLMNVSTESLPEKFLQGLKEVQWGGRCETRIETDLTWHIDGGHTMESIGVAAQWYASVAALVTNAKFETVPRILLFNQQTRDAKPLLKALHRTVAASLNADCSFTHVVFCTNVTFSDTGYRPDLISVNVDEATVKGLQVQQELAATWQAITHQHPHQTIFVVRTIEDAVAKCREIAENWRGRNGHLQQSEVTPRVLATGSLHLVGGLLEVLSSKASIPLKRDALEPQA